MSKRGPIGIFDSGVGGLTVLSELRRRYPSADFIYLGDTARVPYGSKSPETVSRYSVNIARHLLNEGCSALVIACNTASAYAFEAVRALTDVPVIDVVRPVAAEVAASSAQRVLILGTRGTVASAAYVRALRQHRPEIEVAQQACPLFVPLAEEGWTEGEVPDAVAARYLSEICASFKPDAVILGCTHYPLLAATIRSSLRRYCSEMPAVFESGPSTSRQLAEVYATLAGETTAATGQTRYLVTDTPDSFHELARRFDVTSAHAEHVDLAST